jgi:3-phenylpropionate/trans-cinnamate dioxygenase ferredoxin subunit
VPDWVRVAGVEDCAEDGCLYKVPGDGEPIVLACWNGEIFALGDCCSHEDFPLSEGEITNGEIECVLHGARFDIRTGKAVQLPAIRPVKTFPVEIRDEEVFVQVDS